MIVHNDHYFLRIGGDKGDVVQTIDHIGSNPHRARLNKFSGMGNDVVGNIPGNGITNRQCAQALVAASVIRVRFALAIGSQIPFQYNFAPVPRRPNHRKSSPKLPFADVHCSVK